MLIGRIPVNQVEMINEITGFLLPYYANRYIFSLSVNQETTDWVHQFGVLRPNLQRSILNKQATLGWFPML